MIGGSSHGLPVSPLEGLKTDVQMENRMGGVSYKAPPVVCVAGVKAINYRGQVSIAAFIH